MPEENLENLSPFRRFQSEFAYFCSRFPAKGLFLTLLACWIGLFVFLGNSTLGYVNSASVFGWLDWVLWLPNTEETYIAFILPIVLALFWWKREQLINVPKRHWWPSLLIILTGLAFHIIGFSAFQEPRICLVGFFVGLYGIIGLIWGPQFLQATFFPFFLFAFCLPLSGTLGQKVTLPLRLMATQVTVIISHFFGVGALQNGTQIIDPSGAYQYEVAAACSGIRSLTAIIAFSMIYSFVVFIKPWKRITMIAAAFPLCVAANVIRLLSIIFAAEVWGQEAGNHVHEDPKFSLIPYIPAFLGIFALGRWLKEERHPQIKSGAIIALMVSLGVYYIFDKYLAPLSFFAPLVAGVNAHLFTYAAVACLGGLGLIAASTFNSHLRTSFDSSQLKYFSRAMGVSILAVVLSLQGSVSGYLYYRQHHQKISAPGVKVVAAPTFGEKGEVIGTNTIPLPEHVLDFSSSNLPVAKIVQEWLPKDTTYGQRVYKSPDGFQAQMNVVLMGADRTSIHKPQYCLTGAGWHISNSERTAIRVGDPSPYELPAMKLTASHEFTLGNGQKTTIRGIYVYWFVSDDQLSADSDKRIFLSGLEMLRTGVLKRWAYISCFSMCYPGQEDKTYVRMKDLIAASVPAFQLVNGTAKLALNK